MSRMWVASFVVAVMMLHGCGGSSPDGSGGTPPPVLDAQDDLLIREGVLPEFVNDPPSIPMDRVRHGSGLPTSSRIATGGSHSLALDDQRRLWAWGEDDYGQLGVGDGTTGLVEVSALGGATIVSVAAGRSHSLALDDQGRLWAWGHNFGQLGDGTMTYRVTPVAVDLSALGDAAVVAVAGGAVHSLALDDQGRLWAWGANWHGVLGDGTEEYRLTPGAVDLSVLGDAAVVALATPPWGLHTLALDDQGRLWAWGDNSHGQLGDGTTTDRWAPGAVDLSALGDAAVVAVSAGFHNLALDDQGRLWAWGLNDNGQLGDGSMTHRLTPVAVDLSALGDAAVVSVAAGPTHSLALDNEGRLWAWGGDDANWQLPVALDLSVLGGAEVVSIAVGFHDLTLDDRGRLWEWDWYGRGSGIRSGPNPVDLW